LTTTPFFRWCKRTSPTTLGVSNRAIACAIFLSKEKKLLSLFTETLHYCY
jgi:hypothetical protein